jgi:hypothetical protein
MSGENKAYVDQLKRLEKKLDNILAQLRILRHVSGITQDDFKRSASELGLSNAVWDNSPDSDNAQGDNPFDP